MDILTSKIGRLVMKMPFILRGPFEMNCTLFFRQFYPNKSIFYFKRLSLRS
jgi:hypothetical protein